MGYVFVSKFTKHSVYIFIKHLNLVGWKKNVTSKKTFPQTLTTRIET